MHENTHNFANTQKDTITHTTTQIRGPILTQKILIYTHLNVTNTLILYTNSHKDTQIKQT